MKKRRIPKLVKDDPWLNPYVDEISDRIARYNQRLGIIKDRSKSLKAFANSYKELGIHFDKKAKGWYYREWAPAAHHRRSGR